MTQNYEQLLENIVWLFESIILLILIIVAHKAPKTLLKLTYYCGWIVFLGAIFLADEMTSNIDRSMRIPIKEFFASLFVFIGGSSIISSKTLLWMISNIEKNSSRIDNHSASKNQKQIQEIENLIKEKDELQEFMDGPKVTDGLIKD